MSRRGLVCFDVNETLLDLNVLDVLFAEQGGAAARRAWFAQLLLTAQTVTLADRYQDFSRLARLALRQTAAAQRWELDSQFEADLFAALAELPPHADALEALGRLRAAGFQLAALTNSAPAAVRAQLTRAGLAGAFDAILSVDPVGRYKPAPEPYRMAAGHFGLATAQMWMVAAHDWDVLGAMAAGCGGVFIARHGAFFPEEWTPPDLQAASLSEAASALVETVGEPDR